MNKHKKSTLQWCEAGGWHWSTDLGATGRTRPGPLFILPLASEISRFPALRPMSDNYKRVKRFHAPGDCHALTFSCYRRMPLLTNDLWRQYLGESIDSATTIHSCRLVAYVFMPEHVHLLIQTTVHDFRIDLFLKALKAPFSTRIKRLLESQNSPLLGRLTIRERPGVYRFRFWKEGGGYDRNIQTSSVITSVIDYIHENPVRRGL